MRKKTSVICFQSLLHFLQVTFSEKKTKITPQTGIQKYEILEILQWNRFFSAVFPLDSDVVHFSEQKQF